MSGKGWGVCGWGGVGGPQGRGGMGRAAEPSAQPCADPAPAAQTMPQIHHTHGETNPPPHTHSHTSAPLQPENLLLGPSGSVADRKLFLVDLGLGEKGCFVMCVERGGGGDWSTWALVGKGVDANKAYCIPFAVRVVRGDGGSIWAWVCSPSTNRASVGREYNRIERCGRVAWKGCYCDL